MNYSTNDGMCRVSVFKPSGKWYTDVAIDMSGLYYESIIHDGVIKGIEAVGMNITPDWMYVCLEPYHEYAHPVMIKR